MKKYSLVMGFVMLAVISSPLNASAGWLDLSNLFKRSNAVVKLDTVVNTNQSLLSSIRFLESKATRLGAQIVDIDERYGESFQDLVLERAGLGIGEKIPADTEAMLKKRNELRASIKTIDSELDAKYNVLWDEGLAALAGKENNLVPLLNWAASRFTTEFRRGTVTLNNAKGLNCTDCKGNLLTDQMLWKYMSHLAAYVTTQDAAQLEKARTAIFDIHHQIQAMGMVDAYRAANGMKSSLNSLFTQIDKRLGKEADAEIKERIKSDLVQRTFNISLFLFDATNPYYSPLFDWVREHRELLVKNSALIQSVGVFLNDPETGQPVEIKFCTDPSECDLDKVMTFGLDVIARDWVVAESAESQESNNPEDVDDPRDGGRWTIYGLGVEDFLDKTCSTNLKYLQSLNQKVSFAQFVDNLANPFIHGFGVDGLKNTAAKNRPGTMGLHQCVKIIPGSPGGGGSCIPRSSSGTGVAACNSIMSPLIPRPSASQEGMPDMGSTSVADTLAQTRVITVMTSKECNSFVADETTDATGDADSKAKAKAEAKEKLAKIIKDLEETTNCSGYSCLLSKEDRREVEIRALEANLYIPSVTNPAMEGYGNTEEFLNSVLDNIVFDTDEELNGTCHRGGEISGYYLGFGALEIHISTALLSDDKAFVDAITHELAHAYLDKLNYWQLDGEIYDEDTRLPRWSYQTSSSSNMLGESFSNSCTSGEALSSLWGCKMLERNGAPGDMHEKCFGNDCFQCWGDHCVNPVAISGSSGFFDWSDTNAAAAVKQNRDVCKVSQGQGCYQPKISDAGQQIRDCISGGPRVDVTKMTNYGLIVPRQYDSTKLNGSGLMHKMFNFFRGNSVK